MAKKSPPDLSGFDSLPDIARTSLPVVCALFGVSSATVWRRVHDGKIPAPIKDGQATRWIVGELRRALAVEGQSDAIHSKAAPPSRWARA